MDEERTWYEVLGVDPRAAKGDIKTAYQKALDAATDAENSHEVAQVRRAWQVLSDPVQRRRYDEGIGVHTGALEPIARNGDRRVDVGDDDDIDDDYEGYEGYDDDSGVEVVDDEGDVGPRLLRRAQPSTTEAGDFLELPTLGRRLMATIIDALTFVALAVGGGIPLGVATGSIIAVLIWVELMAVAVYIVPTIRTGQTFGKRMTYLMTVDRVSGELLTWREAVIRYIVPMAAIPILPPIGAFLALYFGLSYMMGREQVSLADRLAKSIVVIARYKPSRQRGA